MRRTRAPDNVASLPAMSDTETGGYYTEGPPATIFSKDDANIIQEELVALATMKGASLDPTGVTLDQCKTAVAGAVLALESAASGTLSTNPTRTRALLASTGSDTNADNSLVAAAVNGHVLASKAAVVAGTDNTASGTDSFVAGGDTNEAAGLDSAAIGGSGNTSSGAKSVVLGGVGNACTVAGAGSAVAGGTGNSVEGLYSCALGGNTNTVSGEGSAAVGGGGNDVQGDDSGAFASTTCLVDGATGAAALAAVGSTVSGTQSAVVASSACTTDNTNTAVIGSTASKNRSNDESVCLASSHCDSAFDTVPPAGSVFGGWHASTDVEPSWRLESNGGHIRGAGTVATGGLDYAEWFPNADGKAHAPGRILARTGRAARLARAGDRVLGVVSVTPTIVGGDDSLGWARKWLRDEWGALVTAEVEVTKGEATLKVPSRVLNPAYQKPERGHTPRARRPDEHTCVGLLGQLRIAVDASVSADDDVVAGADGIGTRGDWIGRGAQIECMEITIPYDAERGYAIALCLVR